MVKPHNKVHLSGSHLLYVRLHHFTAIKLMSSAGSQPRTALHELCSMNCTPTPNNLVYRTVSTRWNVYAERQQSSSWIWDCQFSAIFLCQGHFCRRVGCDECVRNMEQSCDVGRSPWSARGLPYHTFHSCPSRSLLGWGPRLDRQGHRCGAPSMRDCLQVAEVSVMVHALWPCLLAVQQAGHRLPEDFQGALGLGSQRGSRKKRPASSHACLPLPGCAFSESLWNQDSCFDSIRNPECLLKADVISFSSSSGRRRHTHCLGTCRSL